MQEHYLGSLIWQNFQNKLNKKTFFVKKQDYVYLAILEKTSFNSRLYFPYSPLLLANKEACFSEIDKLAKENNVTFVRMEPTGNIDSSFLKKMGYKKVKSVQPEITWVLDLTEETTVMLSNMKQQTRNLIKNYRNKGILIEEATNENGFNDLIRLLDNVKQRNSINFHSREYLKTQFDTLSETGNLKIFQAKYEDKVIASSMVYDDLDCRYYAYAGSDPNYRKLSAGTALLGYMIFDAKRLGKKVFDFYGITDSPDPNHPWQGFTKFKKSFGGQEKRYLGTWEKPVKPLPYLIYRGLLSIAKLTRLTK